MNGQKTALYLGPSYNWLMRSAHNRDDLGSSPRGPTKRRMYMNPYEIVELEKLDLICEKCGRIISTQEYLDNESLCNVCVEELPKE